MVSQKRSGRHVAVSEAKLSRIYDVRMKRPSPTGRKCPFGCDGHAVAVAVGQDQWLRSGVRVFTWLYLSSFNESCGGGRGLSSI